MRLYDHARNEFFSGLFAYPFHAHNVPTFFTVDSRHELFCHLTHTKENKLLPDGRCYRHQRLYAHKLVQVFIIGAQKSSCTYSVHYLKGLLIVFLASCV